MLEFFFVYKYNASDLFYYQDIDLSLGETYKSHYWKGFGNPKNYFLKQLCQKIISNFDPMLAELVTI